MGKISYIERRKRNFSIQILKIEKRKGFFSSKSHKSRREREIFPENLEIREEKENLVFKFLKIEKRKRNTNSVLQTESETN